ncbi:MAG TPA: hypothetical protein VEJ41_01765 [Candidatus Acidoferrales bacterium]|nr:hypothetical protein [Candidatus Acidoferrales bacterium]
MGSLVALAVSLCVALTSPQTAPSAPMLPAGVQYAAPSDPVQIESVRLSSDVVRAGEVASGRVLTTSNAAAVLARIGSYQVNVPRVDVGTFALSVRVPRLLIPSYRATIVVTAIRADGVTASQSVSVKVRY